LGEFFELGLVLGRDGVAGVDVEAGVFPRVENLDALGREEFQVHEEFEHMGAEEFFEGLEREFGQRVEDAVAGEESVGDEGVEVGMKVEVFAKGVEGEDDGGVSVGPTEGGAEIFGEALVSEGAKAFEQAAVTLEIGAEHFGNGQDVMAVGHGGKDAGGEEGGGGLDVLLVAGGAEPAAFAGECEQIFVATMVTADADEAAIEVAAVEEFVDDLGHDGAQGAEAGLVFLWVEFDELGEVAVGALPEGRLARVAGAVKLHDGTCQYIGRRRRGTKYRNSVGTESANGASSRSQTEGQRRLVPLGAASDPVKSFLQNRFARCRPVTTSRRPFPPDARERDGCCGASARKPVV
jgi:hypothetical protein